MYFFEIFSYTIAIIVAIVFWIRKKYSYWDKKGFEYIKPEFPFGNLKGCGTKTRFQQVAADIYNQFKDKASIVGVYFFTEPVAVITSVHLAKRILVNDFGNFHSRGLYVNKKHDPLSAHLFSLEGNEWKNMRMKLSPAFTSGKIKRMFDTVQNISKQMVEYLGKQCSPVDVDMCDLLTRFTTDVTGNVSFGIDVNSIEDPSSLFRKMTVRFFNPPASTTLKLLFVTVFKKLSLFLHLTFIEKIVSDFFMSSLKQTVDYRVKKNIIRCDLLNSLLELKSDDSASRSHKLTFDEIAAQSFVFILAGTETTANTLSFTLYSLALNIDVQEKLRRAIELVLERHDNVPSYEAIMEMKYLQMVIDETMRLYPVFDIFIRKSAKDYQIPGTKLVLEKDTLVIIPDFAFQRDPNVYDDPEKFVPERFSEENKAKLDSMSMLFFGAGPRYCIGNRFALMMMKVTLVNILLNFKIFPCEKTTIPMQFLEKSHTLLPKHGMWLKFEKI